MSLQMKKNFLTAITAEVNSSPFTVFKYAECSAENFGFYPEMTGSRFSEVRKNFPIASDIRI